MDRMDDRDPLVTGTRTSEVHTEINVGPASRPTGTTGTSSGGSSGGSAMDEARSRADEVAGQAKEKASQLRDQAQGTLGQAKEKASQAMSQAQDKLKQAGVMERIEQNPLAAFGLAFGVGFLLAGSGSSGKKRGTLGKAKNQLKGAVMGGISAALAQEAKDMLGTQSGQGGGLGDMIDSFLGNRGGQSSGSQESRGGAQSSYAM